MNAARTLLLAGMVGLPAFGLAGCGGGAYVPVSGVVTLDGQPYKGAVVNFQPLGAPGDPNPGRGSYGHTDDRGRFHLRVDDQVRGAVVGRHRVRISTAQEGATGEGDLSQGTPDGVPRKGRTKNESDRIPPDWNESSTKEFNVPPGGTDQANFDIVSKKKQ